MFDAQGVSFVSVTQQFNTTTSMGRLTLNVLLSFAQFEREVIAERVRDKVAASKAKGMWMGGHAPLGYDVKDRKLIVNGVEAEIVRQIFRRYLDLGSVRSLAIELAADGIHSKARASAKGRLSGSRPYGRGQLYNHLKCDLYRGIVHHKGRDHVGEHQAIVDPDLWQAVQARLAASRVQRITAAGGRGRSLLAGLLFDDRGGRLTPTHAVKQGKRYRYYVSDPLLRGGASKGDGWRLPAQTIEDAVVDAIGSFLRDEARLADAIGDRIRGAEAIRQMFAAARDLAAKLADDPHSVVEAIVRRVVLDDASLSIGLEQTSVMRAFDVPSVETGDDVLTVTQPIQIARRGAETKLVIQSPGGQTATPDPVLVKSIATGFAWSRELLAGRAHRHEIAAREGVGAHYVDKLVLLGFLAPDIIEAILEGRQPSDLAMRHLTKLGTLPRVWSQQRQQLGF